MRKVIITIVLVAALMTAGCTGIGNNPTATVESFNSEFNEGNYDTCYELMSSDYRDERDLAAFVDTCQDVNTDKYEFIEVKDEYVSEESAVVDVLVNESSVALKLSLKNFLEVEHEYEEVTKQINLIKEEDGWKITDFPYPLT